MGFERRPAGPSVERQAPSIGRGRRFAGLEEGCPAAMLDSGHPFCDGGAWLGRRVRVERVDAGVNVPCIASVAMSLCNRRVTNHEFLISKLGTRAD